MKRRGSDIRIGDILGVSVGQALVLRRKDAHGGVECYVSTPKGGSRRYLWFYPHDRVDVLGNDVSGAERFLAEGRGKVAGLRQRAQEGDTSR